MLLRDTASATRAAEAFGPASSSSASTRSDDGSREDTREALLGMARDFPTALRHVWQEDEGFRAAGARNRAIAAGRGDYVICIDGDMVLHPDFVADHLALAEPGSFLQGGRLQATPAYTQKLIEGARPSFSPWMAVDFAAPSA